MPPATLSVVIPAYNEERRLPGLLAAMERDLDRIAEGAGMRFLEAIVVDDGSTDGTVEVARSFAGLPGRLSTLSFPVNRGKGAAVKAGMLAAQGDWALMTDADMSTPLDDIVALAAALDSGYDLAIGSRALPQSRVLVHQPAVRELMGKGFNVLLRLATGIPWRDTQCGFKLFRLATTRDLFEAQQLEGFAFDAEICVRARHRRLRLAEVPVGWSNHPDTRVRTAPSLRMGLDILRIAALARRREANRSDPSVAPASGHLR